MRKQVEWKFQHQDGSMVSLDILTNLQLEEAFEKNQSVKIKIKNETFNADPVLRRAVSTNGRKQIELMRNDLRSEWICSSNHDQTRFRNLPGSKTFKHFTQSFPTWVQTFSSRSPWQSAASTLGWHEGQHPEAGSPDRWVPGIQRRVGRRYKKWTFPEHHPGKFVFRTCKEWPLTFWTSRMQPWKQNKKKQNAAQTNQWNQIRRKLRKQEIMRINEQNTHNRNIIVYLAI